MSRESNPSTRPVGIAVLGLGAMGIGHARRLAAGLVDGARLAAVVDRNPDRRAAFAVPGFADLDQLFAAAAAEAVLVATPHRDHVASGIAVIDADWHLLMEKPLAPTVAEAQTLLAAARRRRAGQVLAIGLNQRSDPRHRALRDLLRSGVCGAVQRIAWCATDWFRTGAYFASAPWRGTWQGEGGGLLINQCPHQLDLWCWLFGLPERVTADLACGRWHAIEVEDEVAAILSHAGGPIGTFTASTGEMPGINRLEIACDRGLVTLDDSGLRWARTPSARSIRDHCPDPMPCIAGEMVLVAPAAPGFDQHAALQADFAHAIRSGGEPLAPLADGLASLALANAILAAGVLGRSIRLPLDPDLLAEAMRALAAAGKPTVAHPAAAR